MNTISVKIVATFILICIVVTCAQAQNNGMQKKVMEFNAAKTDAIKWIRIYPLKIGPDKLTVSHIITIKDNTITHKIVNMFIFPNNPSLPKSLDHAGSKAGVGVHIGYASGKEFYIFSLFIQGFKGEAVEYKLSKGPMVQAEDDSNLPGNYLIGHGFSHNLYEFLIDAIESSTNERPIWMPSRW